MDNRRKPGRAAAPDSAADAAASGPLAGVRVLDLSGYIAAPYGCTLLADQGAQVLKIEPPEGDNLRRYPSTLSAESRAFLGVNRGKRGLVLDLKQPDGRAVLYRLAAGADVLVHNFRPSVPERLGIGYRTLAKLNHRLVYCALSGYGESGPLKGKAGYDQVLQAMTGICAMQGSPGHPQIVYGSIVDYYAAALIAGSIAAALYARERTGKGRYLPLSLLRSALAMQSARLVWAEGEDRHVYRDMRSGGVTGLHPTREGYLYLSANTPHFWAALCELVGLPALAGDPRYDTVRKRAQHADEIVPLLRSALAARTAPEWERHFGERVPCSAVREVEDMFADEQVAAEAMLSTFAHRAVGSYRGLASAFGADRSGAAPALAAPTLGQHSDAVLRELGYDGDEIARLRDSGAVG